MKSAQRRQEYCLRRLDSESGATAILIALLALFVLLPLAGLATTAFIRGGTVAELNLAADAGALAGASAIPVGDIEFLAAYIDLADDQVPSNDEIDAQIARFRPAGAPSPLDIACTQALAALDSNGQIGDSFDSGDPIDCDKEYITDIDFVTSFGTCFSAVKDSAAWPYLLTLRNALPGLLNPGVHVTLTRGVQPPLESLVGSAGSAHTADSYARRRFKNAIALPIIVIPPFPPVSIPGVTSTVIDLDDVPLNSVADLTRDQLIAALATINAQIDAYNNTTLPPFGTPLPDFPSDCRGILPALADDIEDLVNPPEGGPTIQDVLDEADATGGEVQVLRLFGFTPFFDFLPVCVNKIGPDSFEKIDCAANAPGAFRATLVPPPLGPSPSP